MNGQIPIFRIDQMRAALRRIQQDLGCMHRDISATKLSLAAVQTIITVGYGTVSNASVLGALLHLEKSRVSRLLKRLAAEGLLQAAESPTDMRVRRLSLTPKGAALLGQIEECERGQLQSALGALAPAELRSIADGLSAFANVLGSDASLRTTLKADIREGYQSGIIASVTGIHAAFYVENYGFGAVFEQKVASEMSEFMARIERPMNTIFSAYGGEQMLGSVSIDGEDLGAGTAHLRWFIVHPNAQGLGVGKQLIEKTTAFVDKCGFQKTRLWTFRGLDAARHLYESAGFHLADEKPGSQWGTQVVEQEFVRPRPF
jgi:DNA-binding MarR family transcriptional regulator/GNAT superfamily N-acetyltransferase